MPQNSLLLEDESQIDLICYSLQQNLGMKSPNPSNFQRKNSDSGSGWFSSFKSDRSFAMSDTSTGYGSLRSDKNSPSNFQEEERFSLSSSTDCDYYSGDSSASSTISAKHFDENSIDALYRNAEFYDLESVDLESPELPESSSGWRNLDDSLDEVQPSGELARADITEMARCVLSMISELKGGGIPVERGRAPSPRLSTGLESIPETESEHIYEEIAYDSQKIDLSGLEPPPLPVRNFHSSAVVLSSCPNCNSAFVPKEKFVRRSLPPMKRYRIHRNHDSDYQLSCSNSKSDGRLPATPLPPNRTTSLDPLTHPTLSPDPWSFRSRSESVSTSGRLSDCVRNSLEHKLSSSLSSECLPTSENKRKGRHSTSSSTSTQV